MKKTIITLTAQLVLCLGFIQAAYAVAIYDAFSSFSITVGEVDNVSISAAYDSSIFTDTDADINTANGAASFSINGGSILNTDFQSLTSGDTAVWTSYSFGQAIDGLAYSEVLVDAYIDMSSSSGGAASFFWEYSFYASTSVDDSFLESAEAFALVDFLDDLGYVDVFDEVFTSDTGDGFFSTSGTWNIELFPDESNFISGFVDTDGVAFGVTRMNPDPMNPVPEPATMILFGLGLAGLASAKLRKKK
jgi:hypothetical protein